MFVISTFCGSRFGGWFKGQVRYLNRVAAQNAIDGLVSAEKRCGFEGKLLRRVVPA